MTRIAFLGQPGSYSDLACRTAFPGNETIGCASFPEVFAAASDGRAGLAMIPVDNSLAGSENVWDVGLRWEVTSGLTLRGSRSRNFRAPTLTQLQPGLMDECAGLLKAGLSAATTGGS